MKEKSAISGSSGFIGSHLVQLLEQSGHEVIQLDRSGDVPPDVDVMYDLGAYGNMVGHKATPYRVYEANNLRIANTIERLDKKTKFIYMSTSSVSLPNQTYYSASKKATEEMLRVAHETEGLKIAIARPFSVYGVGEQWEHLIPKLLESCERGYRMPFVDWPKHDWIAVEDVADALVVIAEKGQFTGEVYEIGTGKEMTNEEVLQEVQKATGKEASLKTVEGMRDYDNKSWKANLERISTLGWKPKCPERNV